MGKTQPNYAIQDGDGNFAILDFYCDGSERWRFVKELSKASRFTRHAAMLRVKTGQIPVLRPRNYFSEVVEMVPVFRQPEEITLSDGQVVDVWEDIESKRVVHASGIFPIYLPHLEKTQMGLRYE